MDEGTAIAQSGNLRLLADGTVKGGGGRNGWPPGSPTAVEQLFANGLAKMAEKVGALEQRPWWRGPWRG